jgi:hypothetical protein
MHRLLSNNNNKSLITDHVNGNTLDNRKSNLRICSFSDNNKNRKISKNNSTGYKGVVYDKRNKKFIAKIGLNKKQIYLGYYIDPIDAARAYNAAAIKYFGEFANLNIID